MARPKATRYQVLTVLPRGGRRPAALREDPVRPGELGDAETRIRRRNDAPDKVLRPELKLRAG